MDELRRPQAHWRLPLNAVAARQRGVTLFGLLFWAVLAGVFGLLGLKVLPTISEYYTIQRAVDKVALEGGSTVAQIRSAFDRYKDVEYSIVSVSGKDLDITKEDDHIVVRYAYQKEIELLGPVFLLIKYSGRSKAP
jgi:hypothetical protein